ncbi:MAG: aconitase X [Burkholderiaceae bacterium]
MSPNTFTGRPLVTGTATGQLLVTQTPLSFWGGVDPETGRVIDQHHPLNGQSVAGRILAMPAGRGSCSGSGVMLELMLNRVAPAALVFCEPEEILTLGVIVADEMFEQCLPVLQISQQDFAALTANEAARVANGQLFINPEAPKLESAKVEAEPTDTQNQYNPALSLSSTDQAMLAGAHGRATQTALRILLRMAIVQRAKALIDITQTHIDACIYNGPSSLLFAQRLLDWGAAVRVPTTLNAISVDQRQWRVLGVESGIGEPASQLGDVYMAMGAAESYTCAPYQLGSAPAQGEDIGWAESNAVVYANSVIGARTQKYADFMDVCMALTGRAPASGAHVGSERTAMLEIAVEAPINTDDSFWPLLGLRIGELAAHRIPMATGLAHLAPTEDDLKAFSAAFATTSSAPMFHLQGVTPEADAEAQRIAQTAPELPQLSVTPNDLIETRRNITTARDEAIDLICLGNPHFSFTECGTLAMLCRSKTKRENISLIVTLSRAVHQRALQAGLIDTLTAFGVQFIQDTCWCMLGKPIVPVSGHAVMTNSGKFAHYAPGLINRPVYFGSLSECVEAACVATSDDSASHHSA